MLVAASAIAALTWGAPGGAARAPQLTDPAGDAHGGAYWRHDNSPTPAGSQAYADVTSILFTTTRATRVVRGRRTSVVTGFTTAMRLAAPPVPPDGTTAVYRVLADAPSPSTAGIRTDVTASPVCPLTATATPWWRAP